MAILRKRNNNSGRNDQCTDLAVHLKQNCWAHAPPKPYQTANHSEDGYFCSAQCTYNWFGQRGTQPQLCNRFHRFARADLPEHCTITDIHTEWIHSNGSRKGKYTLKVTPLNELFHREGPQHVETSPLRGEWRVRMENELNRAEMQGIFDALDHEAYFGNVQQETVRNQRVDPGPQEVGNSILLQASR